MATLLFNSASSQYTGFTSLGGGLEDLFGGPHTIVALGRQSATGAWRQMIQGANSGRTTAYGGVGFTNSNAMVYDASRNSVNDSTTWTSTSDWIMACVTVDTGDTPDAIFHRRNHSTDSAWTHINGSGSPGYVAGAPGSTGFLQIGRWLTSDYWSGEIAVIAAWNARLTNAQLDELITNDKTSDLYNCSAGPPLLLVEMNVDETSLVNIGDGDADRLVPASAPSLTGADPPRWTFDGIGPVGPPMGESSIGDGTIGAGTIGSRGLSFTPKVDTDSATLSEAASVSASLSRLDAFALTEANALAAAALVVEGYTLVEANAIAAQAARSDSLAFSDSGAVITTEGKDGTDPIALTDGASLAAQLGAQDAASLAEQAAMAVEIVASDAWGYSEAAQLLTFASKDAADSITQSESAAVAAQVAATEIASFAEAASIAATVTASESHVFNESVLAGEFADKAVSDALLLTEAASLANALTSSDSHVLAAETASLSALIAAADPQAMIDAAALITQIDALEALSFSEAAQLLQTNSVSASDAVTLMEAAALANTALASDSIALSDLADADVLVLKSALDNLVFSEAIDLIEGVPAPALKLPLTAAIISRTAVAIVVKRLASAAVAGNLADVNVPSRTADADVPYNGV